MGYVPSVRIFGVFANPQAASYTKPMSDDTPIIDSAMSFEEAIAGITIPAEILENLALVDVQYVSFDGLLHQGQLIIHKELAEDVKERFAELLALHFPIQKIIPIVQYGWDDIASMEDNNSSGFNYRVILGTDRLSNHSYGRAIDINTSTNPYNAIDGSILPKGAVYDVTEPGTFVADSSAVGVFTSYGWTWGGSWTEPDWQHFEKGRPRQ